MIIVDLILPVAGLFILVDIMRFFETKNETKFKNTVLDLNINQTYTLQEIKKIYIDIGDFGVNADDISEYSIKKIHKCLDQVQGNLLKTDTRYYDYFLTTGFFTNLFAKQKEYKNNKTELLNLLSNVLIELDNEKKFFGLNKREKEIFLDLHKNSNLTGSDLKSMLELKDIVVNRYQELMKRNEQSDRLSKNSIRLGLISLLITVISLYMSLT